MDIDLSYLDEPVPVDEAINPDYGWSSVAAREWLDYHEQEDDYDGFQIIDTSL